MDKVVIYTDGACSGNPGPGGWAAVLLFKDVKKEISGGKKETTNNEMELTAIVEGLKMLNRPCEVDLYSDSASSVNGFEKGWIYNWVKNDWKTADQKPVKNQNRRVHAPPVRHFRPFSGDSTMKNQRQTK